jgi:hypothetical protein
MRHVDSKYCSKLMMLIIHLAVKAICVTSKFYHSITNKVASIATGHQANPSLLHLQVMTAAAASSLVQH